MERTKGRGVERLNQLPQEQGLGPSAPESAGVPPAGPASALRGSPAPAAWPTARVRPAWHGRDGPPVSGPALHSGGTGTRRNPSVRGCSAPLPPAPGVGSAARVAWGRPPLLLPSGRRERSGDAGPPSLGVLPSDETTLPSWLLMSHRCPERLRASPPHGPQPCRPRGHPREGAAAGTGTGRQLPGWSREGSGDPVSGRLTPHQAPSFSEETCDVCASPGWRRPHQHCWHHAHCTGVETEAPDRARAPCSGSRPAGCKMLLGSGPGRDAVPDSVPPPLPSPPRGPETPGTRLAPGAAGGGDAHGLDFALLSRSRGGRGPAASAGDTAAGCQQTEPRSHGRPGRLPSVAPVQTFNTKRVRPETQTGRSAWVPSYRRVPPNGTQGTAWPACQPWARPRCGAGGAAITILYEPPGGFRWTTAEPGARGFRTAGLTCLSSHPREDPQIHSPHWPRHTSAPPWWAEWLVLP